MHLRQAILDRHRIPRGCFLIVLSLASLGFVVFPRPAHADSPSPGFSMSTSVPHPYQWNAGVGNLVLQRGRDFSATMTITSEYGFSGQVNLAVTVSPENPPNITRAPVVSLQDSAEDLTAGGNATTGLTFVTGSSTSIGDYSVRIYGSAGSTTNSTEIFLTVRAPELDGVQDPVFVQKYHPCDCASALLTTTQANDVVIVLLECPYSFSTCTNSSSVTDSNGLVFTPRGFARGIAEYYAVASEPLESDNITVNVPGQSCCWLMQAFGVAGVDVNTIFDPDPSLPSATSCPGVGLLSCSASINTSGRGFVFAATAINDAGGCNTLSGFAPVGGFDSGGGAGDADYQVVEESQNNLTFTCSHSDPVEILMDAVSLSTSSPPSNTPTVTWEGYDWDGGSEVDVTLNGQFLAFLPNRDSPQNGGAWAPFSLGTGAIVSGTNSLTFTHADWDCGVSDNVQNLQVNQGGSVLYSNPTSFPLSCTQELTYTFTV